MEKQIKRQAPEPRKVQHDSRSRARIDICGIKEIADPVERQRQLNDLLMLCLKDALDDPGSTYALWLVDQALAHGADPNTQRGDPLIQAAEHNRPELVKILLERGAAVSWDDYTVIDRAVACEASNEVLVALLEAGAWPIDCQEELSRLALMRNDPRLTELAELALDRLSRPRLGGWRPGKNPKYKMGGELSPVNLGLLDESNPDPFTREAREARGPAQPKLPLTRLEVPRAPVDDDEGEVQIKVPRGCSGMRIVAQSHDFRAPGSNQARVHQVIRAAGPRGLSFTQLYELVISQVPGEHKPLECARWVFNQYPKRGWGQVVPETEV